MLKFREYTRNFLAVVLALVMSSTIVNVNGAEDSAHIMNYTAGDKTCLVDLSKYSVSDSYNVNYEDSKLKIEQDGYANYLTYVPFDAEKCSIVIESESTKEIVAHCTLTSGEVFPLTNGTNTYNFENNVFMGDNNITIDAEDEISVISIRYDKRQKRVTTSSIKYTQEDNRLLTEFTDYEKAIHTAVIIHSELPFIKVNGSCRYIDYNNFSLTPKKIDGKVYLPLKTLGLALGFYTEELPSKGFALLRNDTYEYGLKDNCIYSQIGGGEYMQAKDGLIFFENNIAWADVKYFAELIGETVVERDDYTFIDYYELANNLANEKFADVEKDYEELLGDSISGNTYFVDNSVASSGNGVFKTLSEAAEVAQAGDTVVIKEGVYREKLTPRNSGTPLNPITYKAEEGANVVISALDKVDSQPSPVTVNGNHLLVYDIPNNWEQGRNLVFVNGEVKPEGRFPNMHTADRDSSIYTELGLSQLWPTMGRIDVLKDDGIEDDNKNLKLPSNGLDKNGNYVYLTAKGADLTQEDGYWDGGTLVSFHGSAWGLGTAKIKAYKDKTIYLDENKVSTEWWYTKSPAQNMYNDKDFAYVTNHLNTVDTEGEWYWSDEGQLYLYPYNDSIPENLEIKARQTTVDLTDKSYINFVGINTIGGGMKLKDSKMCVINGGEHKYISHYTYSDDQHYGYVDNHADKMNGIGAPLNGEMGLYIGGSNNAVVNAKIKYSAAAGLYITGAFGFFENNLIEECGYMSSYVGGIFITPEAGAGKSITDKRGGHGIYNNTVTKTGRGTLQMASIEKPWFQQYGLSPFIACDIAYNQFINGCILARDTGVIYLHGIVAGDDRLKMKVHHNIVGNSWNIDGNGHSIYFDDYIQQADCYSNVTYSRIRNASEINVQKVNVNSFATIEVWNNSMLGKRDVDLFPLKVTDYPMDKYFNAGYGSQGNETGFNNFKSNIGYSSVNAVLKGAEIRENAAYITREDGYICFENVNFDKNNSLRLIWYGDYTKAKDGETVEIRVGTGGFENAKRFIRNINTYAPYKNALVNEDFILRNCSGIKNVYVKTSPENTLGVIGVQPINFTEQEFANNPDTKQKFAQGYINEGLDYSGENQVYIKSDWLSTELVDKSNVIYNTGAGLVLKYDNVVIAENSADTVVVSYSTEGQNAGQTIEIRVDSLESEPIAIITTVDKTSEDDWRNYTPLRYELNSLIQPGTHTIYVTICGKGTTNLHWFGFSAANEPYEILENGLKISSKGFRLLTGKASLKLFLVSYNGGVLENVIIRDVDLSEGDAIENYIRENNKEYKIFLWDENLMPYTEVIQQ